MGLAGEERGELFHSKKGLGCEIIAGQDVDGLGLRGRVAAGGTGGGPEQGAGGEAERQGAEGIGHRGEGVGDLKVRKREGWTVWLYNLVRIPLYLNRK